MQLIADEISLLSQGKSNCFCNVSTFVNSRLGVMMECHGLSNPVEVFAVLSRLSCDTPAARKGAGQTGHSHDIHPCPWCDIMLPEINLPSGYDCSGALNKSVNFLSSKY